jgi:hypothetical protein
LSKESSGVLCLPLLTVIALSGCAAPIYVVRDTEPVPLHASVQTTGPAPTRRAPLKPLTPPSARLSKAQKEALFEAFLVWRQRSQGATLNERQVAGP